VPTGVSVQVAVTEDRAIIGFGESFVGRVLELDPSASLAVEPRYADVVADLGPAANAGVAWADLAGIVEAVESALGDELQVFGMYETEIRPWLQPLDRAVTVTTLEGELLVQRSALLIR
jgi:hypothetical protein